MGEDGIAKGGRKVAQAAVRGSAGQGAGKLVGGGVQGALAAGAIEAVKHRGTRRLALAGLFGTLGLGLAPLLVVLLAVLAINPSGMSKEVRHKGASIQVVQAEAATPAEIGIAADVSANVGVDWEVPVALRYVLDGPGLRARGTDTDPATSPTGSDGTSAGAPAGTSDWVGPYRISREALGADASRATDWRWASRWVARRIRAAAGGANLELRSGTSLSADDGLHIVPGDATAQKVKEAYVEALAALPVKGMSPQAAEAVYATAAAWLTGKPAATACLPGGYDAVVTGSSGGLVVTSTDGQEVAVTDAMLRNVAVTAKVAKDAGLPAKAMLVATITMAAESRWQNLASRAVPESLHHPHDAVADGDRDSVGTMQQRAGWGSVANRMDPGYAAAMFYGLKPPRAPTPAPPGLVQVPGWESLDPGVAAQKVQASAFPDAYGKWAEASRVVLERVAGVVLAAGRPVCPGPTGTGSTGSTVGTPGAKGMADDYPDDLRIGPGVYVADPWSFYRGECVSFAAWRIVSRSRYPDFKNSWVGPNGRSVFFGSAVSWADAARDAGIRVDRAPAVGAIAQTTEGGGGAGHVAYVAGVNADGTIDVEEYNYAGPHVYGVRMSLPATAFETYLHFEQ